MTILTTSRLAIVLMTLVGSTISAFAQDAAPASEGTDDAEWWLDAPFAPSDDQDDAPPADSAEVDEGDALVPELLPTIPVADGESPPSTLKPPPRAVQLEEIVVTATKREMSAREIPVSISAKTGEALEQMGARDIQDYIATVPGITLQEGTNGDAGGRKITVRGVGPSEVNGMSGNQTVGQFIGDIPMTDPYSNYMTPDLDPFDLETVEVLKGPQGTYFGASALNGAIRYVPTRPQLGEWGFRGFAEGMQISEGGTGGTYAAAVNAPIGDTLALRATGVVQNAPGYIDNLQRDERDADSRSKWSARGGLRWQPGERTDISLMFLQQESQKDDILDVDNSNEELTNNQRPGPSSIETGFDLASIDIRHDLDVWGTVVWQSSLQHKNVFSELDTTLFTGGLGIPNFRTYATSDIEGTTHELRLVSPGDGDWSWIVGGFYLDYAADLYTDAYLPGTALPLLPELPLLGGLIGPRGLSYAMIETAAAARETSLYGELTRRLGSRWEFTAGARLYKTRISGTYVAEGVLGAASPDAGIDLRDQGISPKVSVAYRPSDDLMFYATVARGFQFGGINISTSGLPFNNPLTGPPVPPSFGSSSLWSREIGIRTDWLDRTLRADVVVYDLDWSDAQFVEMNDNLLIDTTYVSNVGKVRSQGIEASLIYQPPVEGLLLNVAAGYSRALTAVAYTAASGTQVPSGTEMPNAPRWQTATTLSYSRSFGRWLAGGSVTHTYSSRAYDTITHDHEIFDYETLNLGLNLSRPDLAGAPTLNFGISNLNDARGVVGRNSSTGTSGLTGVATPSFVYIRPRAFTVRLSVEFQ